MVPLVDLVIRSYFRDFRWLRLALMSIDAFVRGYREIVLILPESSVDRWRESLVPEGMSLRLVTCVDYADDYLGQQVSKLYADHVSDADYIVHLDSDCAFVRPIVCGRDLFRGGRPIHMYRRAGARPAIDGWRMSVGNILGINADREFMVTLPAVYPRDIYSELRQFVLTRHGCELSNLVLAQRSDQFSEFSVLGAYAFEYSHERFEWVEAGVESLVTWPCIQFWSRGGVPANVSHLLPPELARGLR
jgi:hypothetical protein